MDYTLSPQHVVHPVAGLRMHDQNQPIPTQVTDKDLNSVIWSIMQVLSAAGIAGVQFDPTNPTTYNRLLTALQALFQLKTDANTRAGYTYVQSDWCWLDKARGLKLQYGRLAIVGTGAGWLSGVASFPLAFSTACFGMIGGGSNRGDAASLNGTGAHIVTAFSEYFGAAPTSFRWRIDTNDSVPLSGTKDIFWIAAGV